MISQRLLTSWFKQPRCWCHQATSKYSHSDDMHVFPASFGFKGEALSFISDVSLLEIVNQTHGRPNGYRNVLKDTSVCTLELMIVDKMLVQQVILYKPEAIWGSILSGVILYDFTRVVDGLVFNSLDAGATKGGMPRIWQVVLIC